MQVVFDVKITARVDGSGTETKISYAENTQYASFDTSDNVWFVNNAGINTGTTGGGKTAVSFGVQISIGLVQQSDIGTREFSSLLEVTSTKTNF